MKKIFYLASIAALALSSCAKDDTTEAVSLGTVGEGKITAAMAGNDDTRTYLDENQKFRWEGTDALAVYNDNAKAPWNGTQFKMSEGDKSAIAVFNGPALNANYNHLAVYPWSVEKLFTGVKWAKVQIPGAKKDDKATMPVFDAATGAVETITMNIPATQEYYPGTFGNGTAPAISSEFVINKDGSAGVSMQPVADYLFVDIESTEPIKNVTLEMWANGAEVVLAGQNTLSSYLYNGDIRYYMGEPTTGEKKIKLVTNERAPEVSCHAANTYVFVVPAGILGMGTNAKVEAVITVNAGEPNAYTFAALNGGTDSTDAQYFDKVVSSKQLNYYTKKVNGVNTDFYRGMPYTNTYVAETLGTFPHSAMPMENTYFYMNTKNDKGEVVPFEYNPNGDVIIEHEGQLLQYLTEYDTNPKFQHDAFICGEHKFDFSIANIEKLSNELVKNGYTEFNDYFAAYIDGTFPCIDNYSHEFKGNGATITGIVRPLESNNGIFGNISGTINDVTFSGINAKANQPLAAYGLANGYYGYVLGSIVNSADHAELIDVTIENSNGIAVLAKGNVEAYKALTVNGVSGLNFIIADMDLEANLEVKNWDAVKGVKNTVFATLDAVNHKVVKLPAGADYAKLASWISTSNSTFANEIQSVSGLPFSTYLNSYVAGVKSYKTVTADQSDNNVVSVLIDKKSYWTGDYTKATADTGMPKQINDSNDAHNGYFKIEYAEQLAAGGDDTTKALLMTDMDMSYSKNMWANGHIIKVLDGNNKTVTGIKMVENGVAKTAFDDTYVAPIAAEEVYNLTIDGVSIKINTTNDTVVPNYIAGLAENAKRVVNVTLKNLEITGAGVGSNNEQYYDEAPVVIGWLVANSVDTYVENSKVVGVNNSIKGVAGLVGKITILGGSATVAGAHIKNSVASNVTAVQQNLGGYINWTAPASDLNFAAANFAGTAVAVVVNGASAPRTISLTGTTGKAVFAFDAYSGNINALYGDGNPVQLTDSNRGYWYW